MPAVDKSQQRFKRFQHIRRGGNKAGISFRGLNASPPANLNYQLAEQAFALLPTARDNLS